MKSIDTCKGLIREILKKCRVVYHSQCEQYLDNYIGTFLAASKNTNPMKLVLFSSTAVQSGSQHQPTQCKSTIADKNNTIKCRINEAIAITNKEKPLWIGTRDWTCQPLTILSCGFVASFLWCHLRLHIAEEVQAIQTKDLFFVSNFALGFWIFSTVNSLFIIFFKHVWGGGSLIETRGAF